MTGLPTASAASPRRRSRRPGRFAVIIIVLGLVAGAAVVADVAEAVQRSTPQLETRVSVARPSPMASPAPVTAVGDRTPARAAVLRQRVTQLLNTATESLLQQDQAGFLGPATGKAVAPLARQYHNLRALKVSRFQLIADPLTVNPKTGLWHTDVAVLFCFVVASCEMDAVTEAQTWADTPAGPRLVSVNPVAPPDDAWFGGIQPWQTDDLFVAQGPRTLVATTAALRSRLPALLASAEKGAAVADTFAIGQKPDLYRIYLAGPGQWKRWYGGVSAAWIVGFAISTGNAHSDVVLDNAQAPDSELDRLLRHEMTHVATVYGQFFGGDSFWLIEGVAELAAHPASLTVASWRNETRSYVHGGWNRKLPNDPPADNASPRLAGELYGIAFLAVKRLDQRFGRAKLIDFFTQVVRSGAKLTTASTIAFDMDWSAVNADIVHSITSQ